MVRRKFGTSGCGHKSGQLSVPSESSFWSMRENGSFRLRTGKVLHPDAGNRSKQLQLVVIDLMCKLSTKKHRQSGKLSFACRPSKGRSSQRDWLRQWTRLSAAIGLCQNFGVWWAWNMGKQCMWRSSDSSARNSRPSTPTTKRSGNWTNRPGHLPSTYPWDGERKQHARSQSDESAVTLAIRSTA